MKSPISKLDILPVKCPSEYDAIGTSSRFFIMKDTYVYEITESETFVEETGKIISYGITIYNSDRELAKHKNESCRVDNISPDHNKILKLKDIMEELELYPIHLRDVVEDFLA